MHPQSTPEHWDVLGAPILSASHLGVLGWGESCSKGWGHGRSLQRVPSLDMSLLQHQQRSGG